jgi:hypothetical protein
MADFLDDLTEVNDDTRRGSLNSTVALIVAVSAAFVALCNVKDGNIVQSMAQAQANAVDAWSYYQAKSTKQHIAEGMVDQVTIQRDTSSALTPEGRALLDHKIDEYVAKVKQYDAEKAKIKQSAEDFQRDYDRLNFRDDQFDMAEASLSLSIALMGVTALTQKRWLLAIGVIFVGFGLALGVSGFMGYNMHPNFIAKLLS